jgi:hypothetical protein
LGKSAESAEQSSTAAVFPERAGATSRRHALRVQEAAMSHTDETDVHKHVPMEKARAGETSGRVRIVLAVSSIVAIVVLLIVVFWFAHPGAQPPTVQ